MAKIAVIANLSAASVISVKDLREKFSVHNAEVKVIPFSEHYKHDIKQAIKQGAQKIIAAGGDGTVNAVANEIIKTQAILGVIPLGTLNHFAKDTHLPLDTDEAITCIMAGKTRKLDVGVVNHHVFVNNSSVGAYPQFVRERKKRQSFAIKWLANVVAAARTAVTMRNQHAAIRINNKTLHRRTPFIFVGNNIYDLSVEGVTSRQKLDDGVLGVHVLKTRDPLAILRAIAQLFIGYRPNRRDFESFKTKKMTLLLRKSHIHVALDGETVKLATPLHYTNEHRKLTLIVP